MAYFANKRLNYAGVIYEPGQQITTFGTGKYDDILLENGMVGSDGNGTGIEDRIAHQKEIRQSQWKTHESEMREEEAFLADVKKYQAEKDLKVG